MERENIIVVPYGLDSTVTGVDEAMEHMFLAHVRFNYNGNVYHHCCCVIARAEEVLPLVCAYYGDITFNTNNVHDLSFTDWYGVQAERKGKILRYHAQNATTVDIIHNGRLCYPWGADAIYKCGGYVLCSQWGYKQIMDWYKD